MLNFDNGKIITLNSTVINDNNFGFYLTGRAFGHAYYDDDLNLIPIQQCCLIRSSTLKTFLR